MRLIFMFREIINKLSNDNITGFAAQSCFYIILSIFPFLLVLISLFGYLPISPDALFSMFDGIIPTQLEPLIKNIIADLYDSSSITFTYITAIAAIWAAGKGFMSIMQGLNIIYDTKKRRNWFSLRLMSTMYTFAFLVLILASFLLLVFGNQLINLSRIFIPKIADILSAILNNRLILFPCFMIILFILMYKFIPTRKTSILREFPGAVFSTCGWYIFSYAYSLYVDSTPKYSYMYGSLTSLVFALIWIYSCMIIIFLGAEINVFISKGVFSPLVPKFIKNRIGRFSQNDNI